MTNLIAYNIGLKLTSTREQDKGKVTTLEFIHCFPTTDVYEANRLAKKIWEAKGFYNHHRAKIVYINTGKVA